MLIGKGRTLTAVMTALLVDQAMLSGQGNHRY